MESGPRFALVLGGGAMRGLAHVGALRALEERGWSPAEVLGTSIGALVGAAWAAGFSPRELEEMVHGMRRRDVFVLARGDVALHRLRAPALYRAEPLELLLRGVLGDATFRELPRRLIVAAVEINSGQQVYFGLPGLDDVPVADAVFASCALPGFFPPRDIGGQSYVDGSLADHLPVHLAASRGHACVVAVDVGARDVLRADVPAAGFAAVYARAAEIVFERANSWHLASWTRPPLLLVRPAVEHVPMFGFRQGPALIAAGHRAMHEALDRGGDAVRTAEGGVHPRRLMQVRVARERCTGCGVCAALGPPGMFRMDAEGKAVVAHGLVEWSPLDGGYLRQCPTLAIMARPAGERTSRGGASTGTAPAAI
jgi:NTE family protein